MSRTWTRAAYELKCGGPCNQTVPKGAPLLLIRLASLPKGHSFRRCARCAGEPVPADLPPLVEPLPITPRPLTRFTAGMLPLSWKEKAAGGREPGQEG